MAEQIITVSVSPAISTILWMDSLSAGQENIVTKEYVEPAGDGLGISRVLSALKSRNIALGFCGEENQQTFFHLMERFDIRYDFIPCGGETRQDIIMLLPKDTVIKTVRQGFQPNFSQIGLLQDKLDVYLKQGDYLVVSGNSAAMPLLERWKNRGVQLVLRSPKLSMTELDELQPYFAAFSLQDFKALTGIHFRSESTIIRCVKGLTQQIHHVAVCLGARGYLYAEQGVCYRILFPQGKCQHPEISDFFTAGYFAAKQKGLSLEDALRYAGGCAMAEPGTDGLLFSDAMVSQWASEIQLDRIE